MRLTKQIIFGSVFFIIAGLIVWWIVGSLYNPAPTCVDGRRNQGEADTDCGGPCIPCAIKNLKPLEVRSKKVFKASEGFGYALEVLNPNGDWAVSNVPYQVVLKDTLGNTRYTDTGSTFIYAGELKYIIKPYQEGDALSIASVDVELGKPQWETKNNFEKPQVDVRDVRTFKNESNRVITTGRLVNILSVPHQNARIVGVVFNKEGSIIGAAQTQIDSLGALETKDFTITFPKELGIYTPNLQPQVQFTSTLKTGDTGSEVSTLQQTLLELGFMQRDPTGFYDVITQDAVRTLQSNNNLEPTGEVNEDTRQFLNSLLQNQVEQPTQQELDTSVDTSKTKVFVEVR